MTRHGSRSDSMLRSHQGRRALQSLDAHAVQVGFARGAVLRAVDALDVEVVDADVARIVPPRRCRQAYGLVAPEAFRLPEIRLGAHVRTVAFGCSRHSFTSVSNV